jgi:hypothetical protein
MPAGAGGDLPEAKYFRLLFRLMGLFLIGLSLYVIFFEVGNSRWHRVAVFLLPIIIVTIGDAEFARGYIENKHLRKIMVNVLCVTLLLSYGWGANNAEKAKTSDQIIKINEIVVDTKYLGWAGDFLFLWNDIESTVVVKSKSTIQTMELSMSKKTAIINFSDVEK